MSKEKLEKSSSLRRCPVTGGMSARMTEHGFSRSCAEYFGMAVKLTKENGGRLPLAIAHLGRCLACRGKDRPLELEILSIDELLDTGNKKIINMEDLMGTKQEGTCQCCGREKLKVLRLHGDLVCQSCGNLYCAMVNRPEAVKKAFAKFFPPDPEPLTAPGGSETTSDFSGKDPGLVAILDGIVKALPDGCEDHSLLPEMVAALAGDYRDLVTESRAYGEPSEEVVRAFELEAGATITQAWGGAIRIAAEYEDLQRKMANMISEDQLREICQLEAGPPPLEYVEGVLIPERERLRSVLADIKTTLGIDEPDQVAYAVAQLAQAFDFRKERMDRMTEENASLVHKVSQLEHRLSELEEWEKLPGEPNGESFAPLLDPVRDQLADFALKVLNGQVGSFTVMHKKKCSAPLTFSPGQVEDYLPISSLATDRCWPSNGSNLAAGPCATGSKKVGSLMNCTSIAAISAISILPHGPDKWIASQRDSLARIFHALARAKELKAHVPALSGKCSEQLTLFGLDWCSSKTLRRSAPRADVTLSGLLWRGDIPGETERLPLLLSELVINGIAGGSLLPTITVTSNWNRKGSGEKSGDGIGTALHRLPTLTASMETWTDFLAATESGAKRKKLPTLCASDYKSPYSEDGYRKQALTRYKPLRDTLAHTTGHRLTSEFAEWWMGWPIKWTAAQKVRESKPAVTARYRSRRRQRL